MTRSTGHESEETVDTGVVKAIGHPLRMKLLKRLNETVASPVELARELGESVQLISYHVRILRDLGFVELVGTTPRRGAIEHHYRAVRRPLFTDSDWAALPANARDALAGETIHAIFKHVASALGTGAFDERTDTHISFIDLTLDEQGWRELSARLLELVQETAAIESAAEQRIAEGAEATPSRLSILHYSRAYEKDTPPAPPPAPTRRARKGTRRK